MRFKCITLEGGSELTLPDDAGSPMVVDLWEAEGNRWCIGVTFDDAAQLLMFETMPGVSRREAMELALAMGAGLRSVRHVSTDLFGIAGPQAK